MKKEETRQYELFIFGELLCATFAVKLWAVGCGLLSGAPAAGIFIIARSARSPAPPA